MATLAVIRAAQHRASGQWCAIVYEYERPADLDERVERAMTRARAMGWWTGGSQHVSDVSAEPYERAAYAAVEALQHIPADQIPVLASDEELRRARVANAGTVREWQAYQGLAEMAADEGRAVHL